MPGYLSAGKALALVVSALAVSVQAGHNSRDNCRCFPGDDCWPTTKEWSHFNETIDGRLVATVPLASPCHAPNYDATTCAPIKDGWKWPEEQ